MAQTVVGNDTFQVTANVLGQCTVSASDLNFGPYQQNSVTDVDAQTTIDVTCPTIAYEVGIDVGAFAPGGTTSRSMQGGFPLDNLDYEMYTDPARTNVWTDVFGSAGTVNDTGTGAVQTLDVYGQIPLGQNSNPGAYADTVNVVVYF